MGTAAIIGIDCATQEAKRGLAYGLLKNGKLTITDVASCSSANPSQEIIPSWLNRTRFALLALDAPLGWPVTMSEKLPLHKAGNPLGVEDSNRMFLRETDFVIWREFKKCKQRTGTFRKPKKKPKPEYTASMGNGRYVRNLCC